MEGHVTVEADLGGPLLKCFGTTVTEVDLPVLAKLFGLAYQEQDCCVASLK